MTSKGQEVLEIGADATDMVAPSEVNLHSVRELMIKFCRRDD